MTCCQTGEAKTHWVFFSTDTFFGGLGCKCKVQKVSNFFWGEDFGDFNHWDSAFPNSRQAPTYNQTCSRLPIDPVSSILDPRPVPLIILLFCACLAFHREMGGQTIEPIKTLQTPATSDWNSISITSCFRGRPPVIGCSPPYMSKCLYVWMFICSHVLRGLQILDIRHWMANTSLHQDTENQK
jgi:hypothetical protein